MGETDGDEEGANVGETDRDKEGNSDGEDVVGEADGNPEGKLVEGLLLGDKDG